MERDYCLMELLKRPEVNYASLMTLPGAGPGAAETGVADQVEIQAKYQGYIARQQEEVAKADHFESMRLPDDFDYGSVSGLSAEVRQRLNQHRPETIGQASRISGVTPAAISLLLVHLKRIRRGAQTAVARSVA
jgi:tRNA uridine 5-carboxymethylaminomethyl modification enzyme